MRNQWLRLGGPACAPACALAAALISLASPTIAQPGPWRHGPGMMGGGIMGGGMMGRRPRHHQAMMGGVPAPYTSLRNPLKTTPATLQRGSAVYTANCASCHGATGLGDGEAAKTLSPPPTNLAWFSRMPMSRWDAFLYWTIADGGVPFGTAMPAFKQALPQDDIWAVITYLQRELGRSNPKP